jgi:hypothetical protein
MRPSLKSAALACAAALLIGVSAASSQGSPSKVAATSDGPSAITFAVGHRADEFHGGGLWRLHVKPGLYHASLRATMFVAPDDQNATEAPVICGVIDLDTFGQFTRIYFADSAVQLAGGAPVAMSGSAVVRVTPKVTPGVVCYVGPATLQLFQPITVTFTSLGHRTYGETTEVPLPGGKQLGRMLGAR